MSVVYPKYDPGPDSTWEQLFQNAPLDHYVGYQGMPALLGACSSSSGSSDAGTTLGIGIACWRLICGSL